MKKIFALFLCLIVLLPCFASCKGVKSGEEYDAVVDAYTALLTAKNEGAELSVSEKLSEDIKNALLDIVDSCQDPLSMGYATKDLNGDGAEELVLLSKGSIIYALFTVKDRKAVLLRNARKSTTVIMPDGTVYISTYVKDKGDRTEIKRIADGALEGLEYGVEINGETASYYKIENGERTEIDSSEKRIRDELINNLMLSPYYYTKTAGFRFIPAIPGESADPNAPTPDFSTYDGILAAYKRIVESYPEYTRLKWANGEFDSLFTITDNEMYDVFHRIYYGGYSAHPRSSYFSNTYAEGGGNAYGYAKKDLNGDGTDELVLMNDNYGIIAVFTVKDGKAVMLGDIAGAWIDGEGRIYTERAMGGMFDRDGEMSLYEIEDGELKQEFCVGYKVNIYLKKDNWYKKENGSQISISKEEGEEIYARFHTVPPGMRVKEYTRSVAGLEFVPLFERAVASESHLNSFTRGYYVGETDLLEVTGVTDSSVSINLKFVDVDGEFDPETNPDPAVYVTTLTCEALKNDYRYEFEKDGVKGYLEFTVNSVWVAVTESENEHVECSMYLFDTPDMG